MNQNQLSQTLLLMATMFACTALVLFQMGSLGFGFVTLAFSFVSFSMDLAVSYDGISRRFWEMVTGEPIE